MSYAQGTTHYNFPQIAGTDRPTFADANEAFRTLDTKLYALEGSATEVDGRLDTAEGNIVQLQSDVQTAQGTADLAKSTADTAVEQIGITNANVSQLTTRVGNKFDSVGIADPYDTTATYAVDDVVTYNGQRYRCTTAVTVAEPFDVTKWTGEDVETVLNEIKSDLLKYAELTGISPADTTTPVSINLPTGFTTDNTYIISAMIQVGATWFDMQGHNSAYAGQYLLSVSGNAFAISTIAANSFSHPVRILIAKQ